MSDMPTQDECMALTPIQLLKTECEVSEEIWEQFEISTGELGTKLRSMSGLQPSVIMEAVRAIRIRVSKEEPLGHECTPVQANRIGLMWRISRRIAHVARGNS